MLACALIVTILYGELAPTTFNVFARSIMMRHIELNGYFQRCVVRINRWLRLILCMRLNNVLYMQLMQANRKTEVHKSSAKIYFDIANCLSTTKQV